MLETGTEIMITRVTPVDEYRLHICFSDGKISTVDFEPFLRASRHPEIRKFLDLELFSNFRIEWGHLVWGDYELCFSLESLHDNSLGAANLPAVAEDRIDYEPHLQKAPAQVAAGAASGS